MSGERRKEIVRHHSEDDLDRLLAETDDEKISKRLIFVKNLYQGDSLEEAANRVGKSESTGSRWARRWNEGGLGLLTPNFGDGRPPKLGEDDQEQLLEMLRDGQPWKSQEIQHLLNEEFDAEYHPVYLSQFLDNLGLSSQFPGLNGHHGRMMPKRFSTSASPTRSTKMTPMSPITNARVTRRKVGSLTTIFVQMAALSWGFSMRHTRSRGTILTGCGTSMTRISNDRW